MAVDSLSGASLFSLLTLSLSLSPFIIQQTFPSEIPPVHLSHLPQHVISSLSSLSHHSISHTFSFYLKSNPTEKLLSLLNYSFLFIFLLASVLHLSPARFKEQVKRFPALEPCFPSRLSSSLYASSLSGKVQRTSKTPANHIMTICNNRCNGMYRFSAIPLLRWLEFGHERAMKKTCKELDYMLAGWLEEHKRNKSKGRTKVDQDFMDVMLIILADEDLYGYKADVANKATCLNMILGWVDTTTVNLTWAHSLLLNNSLHILKKAQKEIDVAIEQQQCAHA